MGMSQLRPSCCRNQGAWTVPCMRTSEKLFWNLRGKLLIIYTDATEKPQPLFRVSERSALPASAMPEGRPFHKETDSRYEKKRSWNATFICLYGGWQMRICQPFHGIARRQALLCSHNHRTRRELYIFSQRPPGIQNGMSQKQPGSLPCMCGRYLQSQR